MRPAALALLLAFAAPAGAETPWTFDGALGATYDSNSGNAHTSDDRRETERVGYGIGATRTARFSDFTALQWRSAFDAEGDLQQGDLSYTRVASRLRVLNRSGEGFYAPLLAAWVSGDWRESRSRLRTGDALRVGAFVVEPLTTQVQARLAYSWTRRDTKGRVFDGQSRALELGLDWKVSPALSVYAVAALERGPIVVSAEDDSAGTIMPKSEHLYLNQVADSVEADPAFGPDWFAFRLKARTRIATLGLNLPLGPDASVDLQLQQARSVADTGGIAYRGGGGGGGGSGGSGGGGGGGAYGYSGFDYSRWIGGVSLLLRF